MRRHMVWVVAAACGLSGACGDDDDAAVVDAGSAPDAARDTEPSGRAGSSAAGTGGARANAADGGGPSDAGATSKGEQTVEIKFKAKFGGADLACGEWYDNPGISKVRVTVQDFRWFVEEVRLLARDGSEVKVQLDERAPFQTKDVAMLDFTDGTGRCEGGGSVVNTSITGKVPRGEYTGIVFTNGVPEMLNHANITDAKPPLQDTTLYWSWRSGYRFIVTELLIEEGASEIEDAGTSDPTSKFMHIGAGGCTETPPNYTCARPNRSVIRLDDFDPFTDTITADLAKVFENIDLTSQEVQCHGASPVCKPGYEAFGVSFDTGMPQDTQTVFGVE